ncbi:LysR family transcriptional regulator [Xanthomonas arboricola pv. juglandis]|nr:LysR family transcriptional regulator [Xanthomonas arboricola pv. juglandis]SYZ58434.1 LysR family transcriptional regulator [Xanthomonas arboricola pv. juglandis]
MLENGQRAVAGKLRVTLPVLFGRHCVAPILRSYARQHPKLELELHLSDRSVDLIAEGFDLAMRNGVVANGSSLRSRRMLSQRKVLCVSQDYLAAHGEPRTLEDLADHALLPYWRNGHGLVWRLPNAQGQLVDVAVSSRMRLNDLEVIADAATEGMGLAWLPYWLVRERMQGGELVEIWGDRPSTVMECSAVWPAMQYLPLRSRLAIDLLAAELEKWKEE